MATIKEIAAASRRYVDMSASPNCVEFVDQSLHSACNAIEILQQRLSDMSYPVSQLVTPPERGLSKRIGQIESHTRLAIPALLKRIWTVVGGFSFVDLESYSHVEFWDSMDIEGEKGFGDGVHIESCTKDWLEFTIEGFDSLKEIAAEDEFFYSISPDGYHKDDISGGDSYGVKDGEWMPPIVNFEWTGAIRPLSSKGKEVDLMGYLRTSILECGGFPGLFGNKEFEPIRLRLIENLPVF